MSAAQQIWPRAHPAVLSQAMPASALPPPPELLPPELDELPLPPELDAPPLPPELDAPPLPPAPFATHNPILQLSPLKHSASVAHDRVLDDPPPELEEHAATSAIRPVIARARLPASRFVRAFFEPLEWRISIFPSADARYRCDRMDPGRHGR
jgi:hypothetical protein